MAIDLTVVQTLEHAVAAARQDLTAATAALRPAAEAALAQAETALAEIWTAHRTQTLTAADQLLASIGTANVLGLFPVALEASLEPGAHRLRLRVWPEPLTRSTHDPALAPAEADAGRRYWLAEAEAATEAEHLAPWQALASIVGPQRAPWVAQALTPANLEDVRNGHPPVFPGVAIEDPANPFVPTAALLPDRWLVLGYRAGAEVIVHMGPTITRPLVAGLDTSAAARQAASNADGSPIRFPPRMRWMTDFAAAAATGMAMEIPVPGDLDRIDQLFVIGVRGDATAGREAVQELLTGHRYGRGLAFVPQGTPTNNNPAGRSGLPGPAEAIAESFALHHTARTYPGSRANGQAFADALGIAASTVARAAHSGAVPRLDVEPEGFEPDIGRAMRILLWMPVLGHFLEDLVGAESGRVQTVRDHFIEHVSAAGPVPVIRVGDQPYGVLPVTALHSFTAAPSEAVDPTLVDVLKTIPRISENLRLETNRAEDLLNFTARPRSYVDSLMVPGTPIFSEFVGNAAWLHEHSNGTISPAWAQGALKTLDGDWNYPEGISLLNIDEMPARPLADEATPAALAALAAMTPQQIMAAAPTGSTLARIARYATLLEWARFAQTAGEEALRETPFLDGAKAAAASNRALWLDLLRHAFDPATPAPFSVDAAAAGRLTAMVGDPASPVATCPGQPRLAAFLAALRLLAEVPVERLESAAHPTLSLSHMRVDAWHTSLATRRLATLRQANPQGLIAGGFGWLLGVSAPNLLPPFAAEFIHAPSHDHAAAAAVLRSAAVRAGDAGSGHADIDLSSRRVRLARGLIAGVRDGRQLKELLGARFERRLVTAGGGALLPDLRRDFPSGLPSGILDGLALRAAPPAIVDEAYTQAIAELHDSFDALADTVTAEAVYQLVRGNTAGALLDIDDVVRGGPPPTLDLTSSPILGTALSHRVAAVLPAAQPAPGWPAAQTARAAADPLLDAWCGHVLGPADATVLTVEGSSAQQVAVGLDRLGVGALDIVAATADGGAELAQRILAQARSQQPELTTATMRADTAWKDLLRLGSHLIRLIARAQPLTRDALAMPGAPTAGGDSEGDLPQRVTQALQRLRALGDTLDAPDASGALADEAALFGIVVPGVAFDAPLSPDDQQTLAAAVRGRLATAAERTESRDQLRTLVGNVLGLVAVTPPDTGILASAAAPPAATFGINEAKCAAWLEAMARVRPALTSLADVLAVAEISGRAMVPPLRIAQAPLAADDPWIALRFTNPRTKSPASGRLSLVLHAPAGVDPGGQIGGFLIDAWSDSVPPARRNTGLAVRTNGPNTRAPQTVLLAVAPDLGVPHWTTGTLVAALRDTIDSVVLRQGILFLYRPLTFLGHRTDGAGISYDEAGTPT